MSNYNRAGRLALGLALASALAACSAEYADYEDVYTPTAHYERFPITVAKGTVKTGVKVRGGHLGANQADTVARFAQAAAGNRYSSIHVRRPAGEPRGASVAEGIEAVLVRNGVPADAIVHTTYDGGRGAPVMLSYTRAYAVTTECGDWSMDLTNTYHNNGYPNLGCASQHNLAAVVANPNDLVRPRSQTPSDPNRRSKVIDEYRKGEATSAATEQKQEVAISTVAQ